MTAGLAQTCPVCGTPLVIPATGRRPVYCGTPCRQAAYRAREAAARAVHDADQAREQLADAMQRASILGSKLAALYGSIPRPGGPDDDGAQLASLPPWEEDFARVARELQRAVHHAAGYAEAHQRAAGACRAARAAGFRSLSVVRPGGDETLTVAGGIAAGFVGKAAAAAAATKPGALDDPDALFDAVEEIVARAHPSTAAGSELPDLLADAVEDLADEHGRTSGAGPFDALIAAGRKVADAARLPWTGDDLASVRALARVWDNLAAALPDRR